jgi:iron complex transport system substrate-binding protein
VFAIGAGDCLVGRTESCDYPPEVSNIPTVGGFGTPNLESLLAACPTHVLETVLADPDVTRHLRSLGIPVVHIPCSRLREIPDALVQLGALTGHEIRAKQLADQIESDLEAARTEAAGHTNSPRVALLFAPDSPITAGRHAFISELLALAGGENIGKASETDYYHISLEWLLMQNPDLILCLFDSPVNEPYTLFASQTGWSALEAVRKRRVYRVRDLNTVSRPGPRLLEGLTQLKKILSEDANRLSSMRVKPLQPASN